MAKRLSPEGRRGVDHYNEIELRTFLVEDAVKSHATYLPWAVAAYDRIGKLNKRGAEAAYQAVLDEVEQLTGLRRMPVGKPLTNSEMLDLKKSL